MSNPVDVSIVIPIYISNDYLFTVTRQCIVRLLTISGVKTEIIVVDDCSPQKHSITALKKIFPDVIWYHNDVNKGFAHSVNLGMANATKELILLLNNDTAGQHPDWLINMIKFMKDNDLDLTAPEAGELDVNNHYIAKANRSHYSGKRFQYLVGWCMLLKRKVIEDIGLFPTEFGKGYWEDTLYSRIVQTTTSYKMAVCKNVEIVHLEHSTFKALPGFDLYKAYNQNRSIYLDIINNKKKYKLPRIEDYKK